MAFIQCHFWSSVLQMQMPMWVLLPQGRCMSRRGRTGPGLPTLYLLHGLSDDHTIWMRRTSIERYVAAKGLAVVMPTVHRGFYTDMATGGRYWSFISEEAPAVARGLFGLSDRWEDRFVAGLSMGGYGAFKLALRQPDRWAAAASLSGAMDILQRLAGEPSEWRSEMLRIFGPPEVARGGDDDLFALASRLVAGSGPRPMLYQICGDKDYLYAENLAFRDHCSAIGLDVRYEEDPGCAHAWDYWDLCIQRVLQWLPLPDAAPEPESAQDPELSTT